MAIGSSGAKNAAVFAAEILAVSDSAMADRLAEFKKTQAEKVRRKDQAIQG
jgi:phosphoribosylcarboxyaminoimidazole (NCAIR) mutase